MGISQKVQKAMESSSGIRKMFEEGNRLKKIHGNENVFDFSLGNPDLEPPVEVKNAIKEIACSNENGTHAYMQNAGYPDVRLEMAKKVSAEQKIAVSAENIIMSVGAAGGLNAVLKAIINQNDEVLVSAPFFAEYTHYCANHEGKLVPIRAKSDFSLDINAFSAALSEKTVAVLLNSPNNPTGKIYSQEEIAELVNILKIKSSQFNRTIYLVADEPYREITYNGKKVAGLFSEYEPSIIVSSFAKNLSLPGERIGYIAVNPRFTDASELLSALIFTTRVLGYVNAPAFFQRVIARSWNAIVDYSSYEKRRNLLMGILQDAGITYFEPDGAFYLFCKVPKNTNDDAFCEHLKKYHILGVPGTGFGYSGYFRLAYCVAEKTILNSASAFKKACDEW